MNKSLVLASLVASLALAACGKKEEPAAPPAPMAAPAPEASAPMAAASEAASAPMMAASGADAAASK